MIPRRSLLRGLAAFVTAPAIVRASSLMPVSTAALAPAITITSDIVLVFSVREVLRAHVEVDQDGRQGWAAVFAA